MKRHPIKTQQHTSQRQHKPKPINNKFQYNRTGRQSDKNRQYDSYLYQQTPDHDWEEQEDQYGGEGDSDDQYVEQYEGNEDDVEGNYVRYYKRDRQAQLQQQQYQGQQQQISQQQQYQQQEQQQQQQEQQQNYQNTHIPTISQSKQQSYVQPKPNAKFSNNSTNKPYPIYAHNNPTPTHIQNKQKTKQYEIQQLYRHRQIQMQMQRQFRQKYGQIQYNRNDRQQQLRRMNRNSNTSVYRNEMQLNNNNKGTKYRDDDGYKNITSDKIKTIEAANIMKMNKNNTDINRQINTNIKPSNSNTNIINKKKPNNNNNSNRNKKSKKNVSDTQDVQEYQSKIKLLNKKLNILLCTFMGIIIAVLIVHVLLHITDYVPVQQNTSVNVSVPKVKQFNINVQSQSSTMPRVINNGPIVNPPVIPPRPSPTPTSIAQAQTQVQKRQRQQYSKSLNTNDFTTDPVYLEAPLQIKLIFQQMIMRPPDKKARPNYIFMPTQKAYFSYRLFKNPENQNYLKAQYYYYDTKYNISKYQDSTQLCIVAPGRNIAKNGLYRRFIDSIQRQNYTNYMLVYLDDVSDDNSTSQIENYIRSTQGLLGKAKNTNLPYQGSFLVDKQQYKGQDDNRRFFIISNKKRVYALANRNNGIRNYCPINSVVLDVDADDSLIGKQAFKFVNAIYQNKQVWMFNSVFIYDKSLFKQVTTGPQDGVPVQILRNNNYRTSMLWKTSQLRTFKAKLFNKINENDFKDQKGEFYQWASDVFTQEPLVQLAGQQHYKHIYQIVYFYDWDFNKTTIFKRRHYRDIAFIQTPYKPLKSLDDEAEKVQNYQVPLIIRQQYENNKKQANIQAKKFSRNQTF